MRDYVLHEAKSRLVYGRWTLLQRIICNWQQRRAARVLLRMDDHMLRDVGLTRADLHQLMRRRLDVDVQWEAERLQLIASRSAERVQFE